MPEGFCYDTCDRGTEREESHGKRYDKGQPYETDSGLCRTAFVWTFVSAVLQHGGYDHRRPLSGSRSAGSRWGYRLCEFSDHRILYGSMQRICASDRTGIWRGERTEAAEICGKQCVAFRDFCGGHDSRSVTSVPLYFAVDADTGEHYRWGI